MQPEQNTARVETNKRKIAKAKTRLAILQTARELWDAPGSYEASTVRVIAKAAGYSTGALFANWSGKEALWREAMGYEPPIDSATVRVALIQAARSTQKRVA